MRKLLASHWADKEAPAVARISPSTFYPASSSCIQILFLDWYAEMIIIICCDYFYIHAKKFSFFFSLKEEKRKLFFKSCQSVVVPIIHDTHTQWCIFEKFYCWKMLSFLSSSLKIKYTPKKYISIPLKIGGSGRSRRIMHSFLTLCTIRYAVIKSKDFSQFPYEYFVFTRD